MAKSILKTGNIIKQRIHFTNDEGNPEIAYKHFLLLQRSNACPHCQFQKMMGNKVKNTKGWVVIYLEEGQTAILCDEDLRDHKKQDPTDNTWGYFYHEQVG